MELKKTSVSDLFTLLFASFSLLRLNLRTFVLASLLSIAVIIVFTGVFMLVVFGSMDFSPEGLAAGPDIQKIMTLYGVAILIGVLVMPPFIAGWFKLSQKLSLAQNASPLEIFHVYSNSSTWIKLIIYGLLGTLLYIIVLAGFGFICISAGLGQNMQSFMTAQMSGDPNAIMSLPASFWLAYIGFILLANFLQIIFLLGFCQATLTESNAFESLQASIAAVFSNLLALLAFTLISLVAAIILIFMIALVLGLLAVALAFIHNALAVLIMAIFYVALLLTIYPLMFSFLYLLWNSLLGNGSNNLAAANSKDTEFLV